MNEQEQTAVRNMIGMLLGKDDARVNFIRPALPGPPTEPDTNGERFETFTPGKTLYVVIAVGPLEDEREREIRRVLGLTEFIS